MNGHFRQRADASRPARFRRPRLPRLAALPATLLAMLFLAGCAATPSAVSDRAVVSIKGSDTMLLLVSRWAEEFMKLHPDVVVHAEGGGTETGIEALIEGDVELCAASRTLRADEARLLLEKRQTLGYSILSAKDALSVYLHPANPVRNLTLVQARELFTGTRTLWTDLGGDAVPVLVVGRQPNSGTQLFFQEHVLQGADYSSSMVTVPTTRAVIRLVSENRGAIGYGGLAFGPDVTHASIDGVAPTAEHVRDGSYPISRYLYLYAAEPPDGAVKLFVDWILSNAGQQVVSDVGYIPLWEPAED